MLLGRNLRRPRLSPGHTERPVHVLTQARSRTALQLGREKVRFSFLTCPPLSCCREWESMRLYGAGIEQLRAVVIDVLVNVLRWQAPGTDAAMGAPQIVMLSLIRRA